MAEGYASQTLISNLFLGYLKWISEWLERKYLKREGWNERTAPMFKTPDKGTAPTFKIDNVETDSKFNKT